MTALLIIVLLIAAGVVGYAAYLAIKSKEFKVLAYVLGTYIIILCVIFAMYRLGAVTL